MNATNLCPCGSQQTLNHCCGEYLDHVSAPTAETLMRSRYTAYTQQNIPYLVATTHPEQQTALTENKVYEQSRNTLWQKLEIVDTVAGKTTDTTGIVEFKAWFKETVSSPLQVHQERSSFTKIDNRWYFVYPNLPFQNSKAPGRNDPCPCGSGKKYKRCCQ